jgi:hypothetical protein
MHWCEQALHRIGHMEPILASEFFTNGTEVIPTWYQPLIFRARAHTASQAFPMLSLALRPFVVAGGDDTCRGGDQHIYT